MKKTKAKKKPRTKSQPKKELDKPLYELNEKELEEFYELIKEFEDQINIFNSRDADYARKNEN